MPDDSMPQSTSPDGTIRVEFSVETARMSHEIYSPRVVSVPGGEVLVDLWGMQWDASAQFEEPGTVRLSLRCYPGDQPGFALTIDARARTFQFEDTPGEQYPLARFRKLIERKLTTQKRYPHSRPVKPPRHMHHNWWMSLYVLLTFAIIFGVLYALRVGLFG